jgi:4-hydroxybutyrate CoA-transferase
MDWREEYKRKLISAEEAAKLVSSGDYVVISSLEPIAVSLALAARKEELRGVQVHLLAAGYDLGWYDDGWQDSFSIVLQVPTAVTQEMVNQRRCDFTSEFTPLDFAPMTTLHNEKVDYIYLVMVSPPDEHGFCSFGASLWDKKTRVRNAKLTLAEINPNFIRTYGDNFIHVSEIDYFTETHVSRGVVPGTGNLGSLGGKPMTQPQDYMKTIAQYTGQLIPNRSTIQIGIGRTTEHLVRLGMLNGKDDLGFHSEITVPGVIPAVKEGIITGKYKTINQGKLVATGIGGGTLEEMQWAGGNPLFNLMEVSYVEDIRVIAAHDNFVAINNILAIDLTGQSTAESLGTRIISTAGGQCAFVCGAWYSKGGRSISVLPSTAQTPLGPVSRIMPVLPEGTAITIPRTLADYVVTEYGIASLKGKTLKERVYELIAIAHPDFRAELMKEAKRLIL